MAQQTEFIPYEKALELKELGFDEPCFGYWNIDPYLPKPTFNLVKPFDHEWCIPAPLHQQAFRWFRDKHGLHGIQREWTLDKFSYEIKSNREGAMTFEVYGGYPLIFKTYEEAELACLNRLIEIVKNK